MAGKINADVVEMGSTVNLVPNGDGNLAAQDPLTGVNRVLATVGDVSSDVSTHNVAVDAHSDIRTLISTHTGDTDNPHSVTASQLDVPTNTEMASAISTHDSSVTAHGDIRTLIGDHISDTANPHSVSLRDVTISNFEISTGTTDPGTIVSLSGDISIDPTGDITATGTITGGSFSGVTLEQVTGGSFSINSGAIVSTNGDISISQTGEINTTENITTTGEISAGSIYGDLFGNLNSSAILGTTGAANGKLSSVTTRNITNNFGRTTMDGAKFYQSLIDPSVNDTTYYEQTCSVSGQPQLSTKTPAYATAVDIGTVQTQKLVASVGTYGEWVEYPYRNGSQTATSGAMQLVPGTTPYMTISAAQIERGAQFRVTGFFKRTQITTNYTGGGGLRIVSNVGTGYVQPKTLTLTTQTTLTIVVDFLLTAVDNGSGSWQLMQSQDAMLSTSYIAENTIITVPKSTDVPLFLWSSCANTITLGTDYKDYIAGFQVYRLR